MTERRMWEEKEDNMIRKIVAENQTRPEASKLKWSEIAQLLQSKIAGCRRTGKQCRERWYNHLNPAIIKDRQLTKHEIDKLFEFQDKLGNKWAVIAKQFPGRTDNNLKNFFYSSLRRSIRQINSFVAHYKKKSNIKPFKNSILTKILNINDQKYRDKLDIKSKKAEDLAQNLKHMLATLSQEQEGLQLDQQGIEFREKIVKAIQDFNRNCKKRKSKKVQQQQEPDLVNSDSNQANSQMNDESKQYRRPRKQKKTQPKQVKQQQVSEQPKSLFKKPRKDEKSEAPANPRSNHIKRRINKQQPKQPIKLLKSKESMIDELLEKQHKLKQMDSKKSSSKYDSRSSGNQQFRHQSSDLLKSNQSIVDVEPRMLTRRSSSQFKSNFVNNLENWRKMESKYEEGGLFAGDNFDIIHPMLESFDIGETLHKVGSSVNQSNLFKLINRDSKTDNP